jgi:hypothetical protein
MLLTTNVLTRVKVLVQVYDGVMQRVQPAARNGTFNYVSAGGSQTKHADANSVITVYGSVITN